MKRRTTTIIETRQVRIVQKAGPAVEVWCAACAATVRMVSPEAAALLAQVAARAIYRRVEAGEIHFLEAGDGRLLICADSLPKPTITVDAPPAPKQLTQSDKGN